ncbi:AraC family transcriptional regulator [Amycolatopsis minnesotensis]|uniref:AraC family transcriptional regulator n=1 Tax=Amycolatopsis minnesotensis TaxID=337894 RepID=UPI003CD0628F
MDVVSDAIAVMRTGQPSSTRAAIGSSWSLGFAPYAGIGFHVALRGGCRVFPERGEPVTLGAGDVVLFPRGGGHVLTDTAADGPRNTVPFERWRPEEPVGGTGTTELLCGKYRLDRSRAHPLLAELPDLIAVAAGAGRHPELGSAVGLLGAEVRRARSGTGAVVTALLDVLLVYLLRAWFDEQAETGRRCGWTAALTDPVVAAALHALHEEPGKPWSVEALAGLAGTSRATLARRFTALVGRPPMAYLTWWRMTSAARLLRESDLPLGGIATRVGYESPYAFAHAFKRAFDVAPGRYRQAGSPQR